MHVSSRGLNRLHHIREPAPLDDQPVIRQNRDTLYSIAIVDLTGGATLTLPDAGERYLSVMVVNEDHYINRILHDAGEHELTVAEYDTDYVLVAARILVDPNDADGRGDGQRAPGPDQPDRRVEPALRVAGLRPDDPRHHPGRAAHARPRRRPVRPDVRPQGGRRPRPAPAGHGRRLGRPPGARGVLPQRRARTSRRAATASTSARSRSTRSGRSRSTTRRATSSRTTRASSASTASRPHGTTTARSPSTSATATRRTPSGSWTAGTTPSASTDPGRRSSTARGRSRPSTEGP